MFRNNFPNYLNKQPIFLNNNQKLLNNQIKQEENKNELFNEKQIKEEKLRLTKKDIFENVYMKPHANVYLASFMKIFSSFKDNAYVKTSVAAGMKHFLENHVCCFSNHQTVPVHFIGSIAYHFEDILKAEAKKLNIEVGNIIKKPIDGLVDYHMKYLIKPKVAK